MSTSEDEHRHFLIYDYSTGFRLLLYHWLVLQRSRDSIWCYLKKDLTCTCVDGCGEFGLNDNTIFYNILGGSNAKAGHVPRLLQYMYEIAHK